MCILIYIYFVYTARDQQAPGEGPQARAQDHHFQGAQDRLRQPRRPAVRLGEYYHYYYYYYTALTIYHTHLCMHTYHICVYYTAMVWVVDRGMPRTACTETRASSSGTGSWRTSGPVSVDHVYIVCV